jgi:hypothetical protein
LCTKKQTSSTVSSKLEEHLSRKKKMTDLRLDLPKNKNQVSFLRMDVRRRELLVHQKQDAHSKQSKPTRGATLFSKPTRGATSALNPAALRQHLPSSTP